MMDPAMMPGGPPMHPGMGRQDHSKKAGEPGAFPGLNGSHFGGPPGHNQFDMPPHMGPGGPPHHRGGSAWPPNGHHPQYMGMVGDDVDPNAIPSFHQGNTAN